MLDKKHLITIANYTMPYGKFKGWALLDVPEEYLFWLAQNAWPEGELGELLAVVVDIKTHGLESVLAPLRRGGC